MLAEGMVGIEATHPHQALLCSKLWGSYFYHPRPCQSSRVIAAFRKMSASVTAGSTPSSGSSSSRGRRSASLRRDPEEFPTSINVTATVKVRMSEDETLAGPKKINTLWGKLIRDQARMCIPDLEILMDYPLDFRFPAFGRSKSGDFYSGFFPADPISLHPTTKR